jgi:hypothetical protein
MVRTEVILPTPLKLPVAFTFSLYVNVFPPTTVTGGLVAADPASITLPAVRGIEVPLKYPNTSGSRGFTVTNRYWSSTIAVSLTTTREVIPLMGAGIGESGSAPESHTYT